MVLKLLLTVDILVTKNEIEQYYNVRATATEGVLCFTDVAGMHLETDSSCCDSKRTVGDVAADMLDEFCLVNASDQSYSSRVNAEEIIKCASETVALKQLSGSLLVTSGTKPVTCTDIPYRDNQIDGAEDSQQNACEQSEPVCSTETENDPQLKADECSIASDSSFNVATSLAQKTVSVAALPSGVYIAKPSAPADNKASATQASEDADGGAQNSCRDSRRLQLQKQFPILHDLSQRPQQS